MSCANFVVDLQGVLTDLLESMMERIQIDVDERGGKAPEYIAALRDRASLPTGWWTSLRRLSLAAPSIERENLNRTVPVTDLVDRWTAFGTLIGLDYAEERERHEGGKREHCHWRNCLRYCQDPRDLRKCTGCGEVRYCSKDCQRL